jgi:hypothetical protein
MMFDNSYAQTQTGTRYTGLSTSPSNRACMFCISQGLADCRHLYDDLFLHEQVPYILSRVHDESRYSYQPRTNHGPSKFIQAPWIRVNQNQKPQLQYGMLQTLPKQSIYPLSVHNDSIRNSLGTSKISWVDDGAASDVSRRASPKCSAIANYGSENHDGSWSCAWPRCTSRCIFNRLCGVSHCLLGPALVFRAIFHARPTS